MTNLDPKDVALQSVVPTVMVPRFTELAELETPGHRILMAGNGSWLEVCRAWLYARVLVGLPLLVTVPYGAVQEVMRFKFGKLPRTLVTQFIEEARLRSPNECAAWVVWNERTGQWRLQMLEELSVGRDNVTVSLPSLAEDEHMVIDLHSHGLIPAFFSAEDNKDDSGECKISGVIGNLNKDEVSTAFRLCVNGVFIPLPF